MYTFPELHCTLLVQLYPNATWESSTSSLGQEACKLLLGKGRGRDLRRNRNSLGGKRMGITV